MVPDSVARSLCTGVLRVLFVIRPLVIFLMSCKQVIFSSLTTSAVTVSVRGKCVVKCSSWSDPVVASITSTRLLSLLNLADCQCRSPALFPDLQTYTAFRHVHTQVSLQYIGAYVKFHACQLICRVDEPSQDVTTVAVIDRLTMTPLLSTIYVQCCRRHVLGKNCSM